MFRGILVGLLLCLVISGNPGARAENPALHIDLPQHVVLGDPFFVRIASPVRFSTVQITWLGNAFSVPLTSDGQTFAVRLLLGTDVKHHAPGRKTLRVRAEKYGIARTQDAVIRVGNRQAPVQRLTVSKGMVTLSRAALARHQREKKAVHTVLHRVSPEKLWTCPFQRPADGGVSSAYGLKRVLNNKPRSPHRGLDIRSGDQAPVVAANAGVVALTGNHFFAGQSVYIDHGQGVISMYFHLSSIAVRRGQRLAKGDLLGRTGSTGRSTGPHLHFGISLHGALVDPVPLMQQEACPQGL